MAPDSANIDSPHDAPLRRPMTAGRAISVTMMAFVIASFVNAEQLRSAAEGLDYGARRNVATFIANPIADLAGFFRLDAPRARLDTALGKVDRAGGDFVAPPVSGTSAAGPSGTTGPLGTSGPTVPVIEPDGTINPSSPLHRILTPEAPLKVWIAGDSLIGYPGPKLSNLLDDTGVVAPYPVDYRVSTGIVRHDVFNWAIHASAEMERLNPEAVVFLFGANDDQGIKDPEGHMRAFGTPEWRVEYGRRVGVMMDIVVGQPRTLFWIGMPMVRSGERSERYAIINEVIEAEAAKRTEQGVLFIPSKPLFLDDQGNYSDYLHDGTGALVRMRAADGIHFTLPGASRLAGTVYNKINDVWNFERWKTEVTTTTQPAPVAPPPTEVPVFGSGPTGASGVTGAP